MSDYIHLTGAEDVLRGGSMMQSAAQDMLKAASTIESVLFQHQRFLDDWLIRFEEVLKAVKE